MKSEPRYERRTKVLLVGVGGQGVVTAAEVLGLALRECAPDVGVCVGQLHGLAQRGGSVESTVAIGAGSTAFVGPAEADVVLGFEPLETLRALPRMHATTRVVVNSGTVPPYALARSGLPYPDLSEIGAQIRAVTPHVAVIDGAAIVHVLGDARCLNNVMLGALLGQRVLRLDAVALGRAVVQRYGGRHRDMNLRAIVLGKTAAEEAAGAADGARPESSEQPEQHEVPR